MSDTANIIIGLIFGSIGVGYCIYGKKQRHLVAFMVGLLLMGAPYVITGNSILVVVSLVLMVLPRLVKL